MDRHTMIVGSDGAESSDSPYAQSFAALCHAGPALWFLPYSYLIPVVTWLATSRRYPDIARNARESVIFWTCAYLVLAVVASVIGWKWAPLLLWPPFALWAGLAAWSAWSGASRPYPVALKQAVVYWEAQEPAARAWLTSMGANIMEYVRNANKAEQLRAAGQEQANTAESLGMAQRSDAVNPAPQVKSILNTKFLVPYWLKYGLAGGVLGALLGGPLSYWFQPGMVRQFVSFPLYVSKLMEAAGNLGSVSQGSDDFGIVQTIMETVISTMVVTGIAGAVIGVVLGARRDARRKQQR